MDKNEPSMEAWTGNSVRNLFNCLVDTGRVGFFAKKDKIWRKMTEWGFPKIMVGYTVN